MNREDIRAYFDLQKKIHDFFGYQEGWAVIPMDDMTDDYWMLVDGEGDGATCVHSPQPLSRASIEEGKEIFGSPIYTQVHMSKWVFRSGDLVLICVDTETDLNRLLQIFDASKECVDDELRRLYKDCW